MYIPIGNDMSVRDRNIVGIFDMDTTTVTARGRNFLERAEKEGQVVPWDAKSPEDMPNSYILTVEYGMPKVYQTSYTTATLQKRIK